MAARTGMSDLITTLRGLTDAGQNDYKIGTVNYWDDTAMQAILDKHRHDFYECAFSPVGSTTGGTIAYHRFDTGVINQESGTAVFKVADVGGTAYAGSAYSMDYTLGILTWNSDIKGTSVYLSGRTYDINAAASDVWRHKAVNVAKMYDFSTDNHKMTRSQLFSQFMEMSNYFREEAGPTIIQITRGDMVTDNYDLD